MNPAHRDGWPPAPGTGAGNSHREGEPQQTQSHRPGPIYGSTSTAHPSQSSPHSSSSGLPQPHGHFVPYQQSGHTLPNISSLNHSSPRGHAPQPAGPHSQGLPGIGQDRGREQEARGRDAREVHIKEEQDAALRRDRDARERAHMDQVPPHQAQAGPMHLHQPVAVGPRTVHGPNGLLGNPAAIAAPNAHGQMGASPGPANVFAGGPVQPAAQPGQPMQPGLMVPFPPTAQAAAVGQGQQPILNDALSYLDQVKVQFVEHPDVYNRFLDIMKDFKSGAIDTPGVIDRVSSLFAGNPDLIQGFNTFLPPGYRIECGTGDDPNAIRVTTPMGNTVLAMPAPHRALSRGPDGPNGSYTPQPGQHGMYSPSGRPIGPNTVSAQLAAGAREAREREQQALVHQQEQRGVNALGNAVSAATNGGLTRQAAMSPVPGRSTPLPGQGPAGQDADAANMEKSRGPVEFNHAISYVNKIKNRFASQPDIYKQFLEILQTYQRESKPIQDVYGQVTRLFHQAPDLLEDFKQFLPESAAHAKAAAQARQQAEEAAILSNVRGDPYYPQGPQPHQTPRAEHRLPPVGNFAPTPTVNKDNKRKRGDRQGTVTSGMGTMVAETAASASKNAAPAGPGASMNKRTKHQGQRQPGTGDVPPVSPTLVPALPEPLPPTSSSMATQDELSFFDRAKKTIGNKNTMNEFLKLCNLFSQDLIDKATLVHRARSFIGGNPELFKWFQNWVGYNDEEIMVIENKARIPSSRVLLSNCRALGPSYRLLPKRERLKPCSGRDDLCNLVLNDDWASHPTWASEDSGFIAHRKNVHEEGLHKIEEERHDYDFHIEACGRTIQLLEPIAQQLLRMPEKERESIEIPPGIGGQSETIHKRIIKKLYGREKGQQVVDQLHSRPYAVIPVLLNRLKQKHEEWKQAQREWEKVWRDQTQRMFWKSLDHQAVNAKQADKRQFQTKTLLNEIATKYEEQKKQRMTRNAPVKEVTAPQLSFDAQDVDVLVDATYLLMIFAEQASSTEFPRLNNTIKEFVPLFFGIDPDWFSAALRARMGDTPFGEMVDDSGTAFDDAFSSRGRKTGKKDDLRRGVLDRGNKSTRRDDGSATPLSRASTPDNASRADEDMGESVGNADDLSEVAHETWIDYPAGLHKFKDQSVGLHEPHHRDVFNLYGNAPVYCFMRMLMILYERLNNLKKSEDKVRESVTRAMAPKPAEHLGLVDKPPTEFFGDVSPNASYYPQVLAMFEDMIKNDGDMAHIEEALRRHYLDCGWQLYSLDKLLASLARFASGVMGGDVRDKSPEILALFKKDRVKDETTHSDEMNYRKQVEKLIKDGDTYKISYDQIKQQITFKIFRREEPTFDVSQMEQVDRWRVYINDFVSRAPTHGAPIGELALPVLKRNVRVLSKRGTITPAFSGNSSNGEYTDETGRQYDILPHKEGLGFKVAVNDYKLFFTINDDEYWHQPASARAGNKETAGDARELVHHRNAAISEKFVTNNASMKDISQDDVGGKKDAFRKMIEQGATVSPNDDDMAMEDA